MKRLYDPAFPTMGYGTRPRTAVKKARRRAAPKAPMYKRIASAIEKKYFETSVINIGDVSAGVIKNSLNLIPQGTTDITRIANKITIKNINIHAYASNDDFAGAAFGGGCLRVILFEDKQANGATAAVTDILKTATIDSFRNLDQVDRFKILKEFTMRVPVESTNALHTATSSYPWSISVKCNITVHFSSTTGAITELRSNNIGLLYISDGAAVNAASIGTARVKFIDI